MKNIERRGFRKFAGAPLARKLEQAKRYQGAGQEMFQATPKEFQKLFWRILDSGKPLRSILIILP